NAATGIIKKSGGTGISTFSVPLTAQSGSQFLLQSGTVYLYAVTSTGATFNIRSEATRLNSSHETRTYAAASIIYSTGTLHPASAHPSALSSPPPTTPPPPPSTPFPSTTRFRSNAATGIIKKSGGTGISTFSVPLTAQSGSQFLLQSGTVYLYAVTSTGATFNI